MARDFVYSCLFLISHRILQRVFCRLDRLIHRRLVYALCALCLPPNGALSPTHRLGVCSKIYCVGHPVYEYLAEIFCRSIGGCTECPAPLSHPSKDGQTPQRSERPMAGPNHSLHLVAHCERLQFPAVALLSPLLPLTTFLHIARGLAPALFFRFYIALLSAQTASHLDVHLQSFLFFSAPRLRNIAAAFPVVFAPLLRPITVDRPSSSCAIGLATAMAEVSTDQPRAVRRKFAMPPVKLACLSWYDSPGRMRGSRSLPP